MHEETFDFCVKVLLLVQLTLRGASIYTVIQICADLSEVSPWYLISL